MIVAPSTAIIMRLPNSDNAVWGQATTAVRSVFWERAAALTSSRLAVTRRLRMSTASDLTLAAMSLSSRASATFFSKELFTRSICLTSVSVTEALDGLTDRKILELLD